MRRIGCLFFTRQTTRTRLFRIEASDQVSSLRLTPGFLQALIPLFACFPRSKLSSTALKIPENKFLSYYYMAWDNSCQTVQYLLFYFHRARSWREVPAGAFFYGKRFSLC